MKKSTKLHLETDLSFNRSYLDDMQRNVCLIFFGKNLTYRITPSPSGRGWCGAPGEGHRADWLSKCPISRERLCLSAHRAAEPLLAGIVSQLQWDRMGSPIGYSGYASAFSEKHKHTNAHRNILILLSLCLLLIPSICFSQKKPVQVKASVDQTTITIGDILNYRIEVAHSENYKVAFPEISSTLGEWSVRSSNRLPTRKTDGGNLVDTVQLQLSVYKTGEFNVPAIQIEAVGTHAEKEVVTSDPIRIKVQSVLTGSSDTLKDVKPQAEIEPDYKPFLLFLAALLAAAILIYMAVQYFKNRQKAAPELPRVIRPPDEIALEAIRQLLARKLIEQGKLKEFYLELSEIIKRFLGARLNIPSLERTTEEFLLDLRSTMIPASSYQTIREFLTDCDLVKFAKYLPADDEIQIILARSNEIIKSAYPSLVSDNVVVEAAK